MFQALFNSLSGLFSFSRSLDTVSNNVANMNTPGFRGSDSFFENVAGGRGTNIAGEGLRTSEGEIRPTGERTDAAINGNGFFILRNENGDLYYTRAGQFRFDENGILIDSVSEYQVMAIDANGTLVPINRNDAATLPGAPTTEVGFAGNILPASNNTPATYTINQVTVYTQAGEAHTLSVKLDQVVDIDGIPVPGEFKVTVTEAGQTVEMPATFIKFNTDGTLMAGFSEFNITLNYLGVSQTVKMKFGEPGAAVGGVTNQTILGTQITATPADGHAPLGLINYTWDDKGILKYDYAGSEHRDGPQLALARFPSESALELIGGRLVSGSTVSEVTVGRAGDPNFGSIVGGSLEGANVDLTQEFADMIIIQRGYQASSRVMTVSNEMIEQLYNSTRGG